jgi:hypothetical protein
LRSFPPILFSFATACMARNGTELAMAYGRWERCMHRPPGRSGAASEGEDTRTVVLLPPRIFPIPGGATSRAMQMRCMNRQEHGCSIDVRICCLRLGLSRHHLCIWSGSRPAGHHHPISIYMCTHVLYGACTSQQYFSLRTNQPAVLFYQNRLAPAISHQSTERAVNLDTSFILVSASYGN